MADVEQRAVPLHGHQLAYRIAGDLTSAAPLVLVHGLAGSSATWNEVLPVLGERVPVLAPDLPGHGDSDKPRQDYSLGAHANAVRDLLVAMGIERATIVGHSLGGGVAMQFAYQYPERCERLVLVSSGGLGPDVSWLLRALTLPGAELLMPAIFPSFVRDAGNAVGRRLSQLGVRWPRLEQEWQAYASLVDTANRRSFLRTLRGVVDPAGQCVHAGDRLYLAAGMPTLIVWGGRDRIIPVSHAATAHESIPGSELLVFERSGHFPQCEEPAAFSAAVTGFLDRTEPRTWSAADWQAALSE